MQWVHSSHGQGQNLRQVRMEPGKRDGTLDARDCLEILVTPYAQNLSETLA